MSKITLFAITQMVALAIKGIKAAIRALRVILDLCDDGRLNQSRDLPEWAKTVLDVLEALEQIQTEVEYVEDGSSADYFNAQQDSENEEGHA